MSDPIETGLCRTDFERAWELLRSKCPSSIETNVSYTHVTYRSLEDGTDRRRILLQEVTTAASANTHGRRQVNRWIPLTGWKLLQSSLDVNDVD